MAKTPLQTKEIPMTNHKGQMLEYCITCGGKGKLYWTTTKCPETGKKQEKRTDTPRAATRTAKCPRCNGAGIAVIGAAS